MGGFQRAQSSRCGILLIPCFPDFDMPLQSLLSPTTANTAGEGAQSSDRLRQSPATQCHCCSLITNHPFPTFIAGTLPCSLPTSTPVPGVPQYSTLPAAILLSPDGFHNIFALFSKPFFKLLWIPFVFKDLLCSWSSVHPQQPGFKSKAVAGSCHWYVMQNKIQLAPVQLDWLSRADNGWTGSYQRREQIEHGSSVQGADSSSDRADRQAADSAGWGQGITLLPWLGLRPLFQSWHLSDHSHCINGDKKRKWRTTQRSSAVMEGLSGERLSKWATASPHDLFLAPNAFVGFNDKLVAFLQLILSKGGNFTQGWSHISWAVVLFMRRGAASCLPSLGTRVHGKELWVINQVSSPDIWKQHS